MASSSSSPARFIKRDAEEAGTNKVDQGEQVAAGDRAIFLTFTRGYAVSKAELHAYFTRRYGDIIEAIDMAMGEEGGDDQALFAVMVLRSVAKVAEIVTKQVCMIKFNINGKPVWARRFVNHSN